MFSHVAQGLLRHMIQLVLNIFGKLVRSSVGAERTINSAITRKALGELAQGVRQMCAFERLWPQSQQHPASVFQTAFRELSCAGQTLRGSLSFIRAIGRLQVQ